MSIWGADLTPQQACDQKFQSHSRNNICKLCPKEDVVSDPGVDRTLQAKLKKSLLKCLILPVWSVRFCPAKLIQKKLKWRGWKLDCQGLHCAPAMQKPEIARCTHSLFTTSDFLSACPAKKKRTVGAMASKAVLSSIFSFYLAPALALAFGCAIPSCMALACGSACTMALSAKKIFERFLGRDFFSDIF